MRIVGRHLRLSATDLANHLSCEHLTQLSRAAAEGRAKKPKWHDPIAEILRERGAAHESAYLAHLRQTEDADVAEIAQDSDEDRLEQTCAAMRAGAQLIYQAALGNASWHGRADFLHRSNAPSKLGAWSYEVIDAKLATTTRAGTILQLCVYSELVAEIQGAWPDRAYVVAPHHDFVPEAFRLADYTAYYRLVKRRLQDALARGDAPYPEPVLFCDVCAWWKWCNKRRRTDDHLSFVAGISRLQIKELRRIGLRTLEQLGDLREVPKPARGSRDALTRARDQARIQLEARRGKKPLHEILEPIDAEHGLAMLPAPSAQDLFLDLEGDRLAANGGRDYLFGYVSLAGDYVPLWATTAAEEKAAFERLVDFILAAFREHPDMHVYHFGAYEPSAFKRLSGHYATRESELDVLLRAELFVDLYTVVRHAMRASVESYSIKELEQFYGFRREQDLREATASRRAIEWAIEFREPVRDDALLAPHLEAVERYNREDCVSAERLRDWLEALRQDVETGAGIELPRPELKSGDASDGIEEAATETQRVMDRLLEGIPPEAEERSDEEQARWLLAHLLEWHRREEKAAWWEYFRLRDLPLDEYFDDRSALAGLGFVATVAGTPKRPVHRYHFPAQDHDLRRGDEVCVPGGGCIGKIDGLDLAACTIDLQHAGKWADERPACIFVRRNVPPGSKPAALLALGQWVAEHGIDAPGAYRAARDLILRRAPRVEPGSRGIESGGEEDEVAKACRLVQELDHGVLPIQGPPGTGKTYTGGHMIVDLVRAGRKVGVTAVSHEVIRNLLVCCTEVAREQGTEDFRCLHKGKAKDGSPETLQAIDDYKRIHGLFDNGEHRVLGGTAWLWARPDFAGSADVLFIDEAGQMSLADVLALAGAAKSLVLLGDPQQLEQPQQASHPPGTGVSALEHILGSRPTISDSAGLFLQQTRRLHPGICKFTAELFYENRVSAFAGLERQAVIGARRFPEAGLAYLPVRHEGRQARSMEEVEAISEIVIELTSGVSWRDQNGAERPLTEQDLMIVAPYNAQVTALAAALPGVRIGTVDKFQGQQAPVVIVSLTTSSHDEAPRGMNFLYSANRLNVATSRAKGLCILVGNPKLFEPDCRTPEQMKLANAFCRYLEMATVVED